jgi:hypothetical protein
MIMTIGSTARAWFQTGACSFLLHIIESRPALGPAYRLCGEGFLAPFHAFFLQKKIKIIKCNCGFRYWKSGLSSITGEQFLTGWVTVGFSRQSVLHGISLSVL